MGYRDILRGPQLKLDYDNYLLWLAKSTAQKQALYRASRQGTRFTYTRTPVWIAPFGQTAKTLFVECKGPAAGSVSPASVVLSLLAGNFAVAAPVGANDIILDSALFPINKLAKMSVKIRKETATSDTASRITGREYKHHATDSASMPFGKNATSDSYASVVKDIRSAPAYKTFISETGKTISFTPED